MSDGERRDGERIEERLTRRMRQRASHLCFHSGLRFPLPLKNTSTREVFFEISKKDFHQGSVFLKLAKKTSTREVFF